MGNLTALLGNRKKQDADQSHDSNYWNDFTESSKTQLKDERSSSDGLNLPFEKCQSSHSLQRGEVAMTSYLTGSLRITDETSSSELNPTEKHDSRFSNPNVNYCASASKHKSTMAQRCSSGSSNNNVSYNEEAETAISDDKTNFCSSDYLYEQLIEKTIPMADNEIKTIILNVKEDEETAKELAEHLRKNFGCRAATIEELDTLYRMCGPQVLSAAQKWASVLIVIVSRSWIRAIKNVHPSSETDHQTARYHQRLIEEYYLQSSCVNYTLLSVLKPGTQQSDYSGIIEIKDPHPLERIKKDANVILNLHKWSKRGKEIVEKTPKKISSLQNPD